MDLGSFSHKGVSHAEKFKFNGYASENINTTISAYEMTGCTVWFNEEFGQYLGGVAKAWHNRCKYYSPLPNWEDMKNRMRERWPVLTPFDPKCENDISALLLTYDVKYLNYMWHSGGKAENFETLLAGDAAIFYKDWLRGAQRMYEGYPERLWEAAIVVLGRKYSNGFSF